MSTSPAPKPMSVLPAIISHSKKASSVTPFMTDTDTKFQQSIFDNPIDMQDTVIPYDGSAEESEFRGVFGKIKENISKTFTPAKEVFTGFAKPVFGALVKTSPIAVISKQLIPSRDRGDQKMQESIQQLQKKPDAVISNEIKSAEMPQTIEKAGEKTIVKTPIPTNQTPAEANAAKILENIIVTPPDDNAPAPAPAKKFLGMEKKTGVIVTSVVLAVIVIVLILSFKKS